MRAHIIDRVIFSIVQENGNDMIANLESLGLPFLNFTHSGDRYKIGR